MKVELIKHLRCLTCGSSKFEVKRREIDLREIREGMLICTVCGDEYGIEGGIVDFMKGTPLPEEGFEIEGLSDKWLLSLPYPRMDVETSFESKRGDKAVNFFDMLFRMDLKGGERVLELAAGTCWATNIFAQIGCYCVACDVIRRKFYGLSSADVYIDNGAYFERVLCGFGELPFVDNSFDIVFIQSGLQYAPDLAAATREIARVLKEGGKLVLVYTGTYGLLKRRDPSEPGFTLREYLRHIKLAGLRPKLIFPAFIIRRLEERDTDDTRFPRLARAIALAWNSIPGFKALSLKLGTYPMTLLFGAPINLIALKETP